MIHFEKPGALLDKTLCRSFVASAPKAIQKLFSSDSCEDPSSLITMVTQRFSTTKSYKIIMLIMVDAANNSGPESG